MNAPQDKGEVVPRKAQEEALIAHKMTTRVLAVECSDEAREHLRALCGAPSRLSDTLQAYEIEEAGREQATFLIRSGVRMCVVLGRAVCADARAPEFQELLKFVQEVSELGAPVIVLAEEECPEDDRALMKAGAVDYLVRSHINAALFERALRYAIERKKTESALQEAQDSLLQTQERMARLSANAPGVVYQWKLDADGQAFYLFLSEGAADVFGPRYSDLLGRNVAPFIDAHLHPDDREAFWETARASARDLSPWKWVGRILRPTSAMNEGGFLLASTQSEEEAEEVEEIWLDCRARPARNSDNSVVWDGIMLDCTARMRAKEALRRAHSELEERVQRRTSQLQERTSEMARLNATLHSEIIERSRAEAEVRHRARQQEALAQLSQAALQGAEMPLLLRGAVSLVTATLDVEVAAIVSDDPTGHRRLCGVAWSGDMGEDLEKLSASERQASLLQQVLDGAPARVVRDWAAIVDWDVPSILREKGLRSSIYAPIPGQSDNENVDIANTDSASSNSGIFGVLVAHSTQVDAFSSDDVGFVDAMAHVLATVIDRRRLEDALGQSQARLQAILDNASNMIYVKDREGRYVLANRHFETIHAHFAPNAPPLVGSFDEDFLSPQDARLVRQNDDEVLQSGQAHTFEETLESSIENSEPMHFLSTKFPLFDESGQVVGVGGISADITERKGFEIAREAVRAEAVAAREEAEHARAEAVRANAAKSEFLSRMSHELRTPLNAILGFAQLLEISRLPERSEQGVRQILKAGRHLLALINEVLDISRIESGHLTTSLEPVPLRHVLEEVAELIEPLATAQGVRLELDSTSAGDHAVLADRQRLIQVLLNLISNGVKYNKQGGHVHIGCSPADPPHPGQNPSHPKMRVLVSDSGEGIPQDRMARLWVPFDRLDAEKNGIEGTGLGLALSRALAESMGGVLHAESRPGEGSTFWIELQSATLPASQPAAYTLPPSEPKQAQGTVLYIEDNPSNLHLVEEIFEHRPHLRLLWARTGGDGLQIAQAENPDLILLDLDLPDLHGLSVLEKLKGNPRTQGTPVLIVSADATGSQITRLLKAGAYGYITKPLDVARLLQVVDDVLVPNSS